MIKYWPIVLVMTLPLAGQSAVSLDLEYVRSHYEKAASSKQVCESLIAGLSANIASDVHRAYLGAFQTIWAKHVASPTAKLNTFNKGKRNIEKAVKAALSNVEIRFIRLSVQQHAPAFLDYDNRIKEDKNFILKHKSEVKSAVLLQLINRLL